MRAIVSTAFADIFRANALSNGMLPVVVSDTEHAAIVRELTRDPATPVRIDLPEQSLTVLTEPQLRCAFPIDAFDKRCLLQGVDHLGYLLEADAEIAAYEATHPAPLCTTS